MGTLISLESIDDRIVAVSLARPDLRVEAATEAEAVAGMTALLRKETAGKKIVSIELDDGDKTHVSSFNETSAEILRLVMKRADRRRKRELQALEEAQEASTV